MHSIYSTPELFRLVSATQGVLALIQSGEMLADTADAKAISTEAADRLEQALEPVSKAVAAATNISPFIRYRSEILGGYYETSDNLRKLVLHLWNHDNPMNLGRLFWGADKRHTRIALELICSYTCNGENDPNFMTLAQEIRDNYRAEVAA